MIDPLSPLAAGISSPKSAALQISNAVPHLKPGGARSTLVDFETVLGRLITDTVGALRTAEATAINGVLGRASVQETVEAVLSAEQTLQAAIAIRDKVVAAYLELSRMAI